MAAAGLAVDVPSFVFPDGGIVISLPGMLDVLGLPVEGIVIGVVDCAMAVVPISNAAAKASDFIGFPPLLRARGQARVHGVNA